MSTQGLKARARLLGLIARSQARRAQSGRMYPTDARVRAIVAAALRRGLSVTLRPSEAHPSYVHVRVAGVSLGTPYWPGSLPVRPQ